MAGKRTNVKRKKILFVCTGNTCRSPMAESLLRQELKRRKIRFIDTASAGLHVEKGATLSENSQAVLRENNIPVAKRFRPRQLTDKIFDESFTVITMTDEHKKRLPKNEKVYTMSELTGENIPDPYGQGIEAYRVTYQKLQAGMKVIADIISEQTK